MVEHFVSPDGRALQTAQFHLIEDLLSMTACPYRPHPTAYTKRQPANLRCARLGMASLERLRRCCPAVPTPFQSHLL